MELLDRDDGAGWDLLGDLLLAWERLSEWYKDGDKEGIKVVSAARLLSHRFFQKKLI